MALSFLASLACPSAPSLAPLSTLLSLVAPPVGGEGSVSLFCPSLSHSSYPLLPFPSSTSNSFPAAAEAVREGACTTLDLLVTSCGDGVLELLPYVVPILRAVTGKLTPEVDLPMSTKSP